MSEFYSAERLKTYTKIICIFFSCVLFTSYMSKSVNLYSFSQEIRLYIDAYFLEEFQVYSNHIAIIVSSIEFILFILLLCNKYLRIAKTSLFATMSFFIYLTGLNLFYPTIMGSIESCGCFGELIHFSPLASFIKSVVLWILSLALLFCTFKSNMPWNVGKLFKDKYLYISIATSFMFPLYSLWFLEMLSHTVYIIGYVALCLVLIVCICVGNKNDKRGQNKTTCNAKFTEHKE